MAAILAQRLTTLARLSRLAGSDKPLIVLTTVNAIVQRVPARDTVAAQALSVAPGHVVPMDSIVAWLEHNGYNRSSTVREPGEYAVRGGILDLFPAGLDQPVRFDFFGDQPGIDPLLRRRNPAHAAGHALARSGADLGIPAGHRDHPPLPDGLCRRVRRARARRSAVRGGQRRPPPSRHGALAAAVPGAGWIRCSTISATQPIAIEPQSEDAARERFKQIADYYEARREALEHPGGGAIYKPLPPDRLYLTERRVEQTARTKPRWRG